MIIRLLASTLDPAERDAVLGDLAESRQSKTQAARDVLDLVARRQLQAWKHAGPWITLLVLLGPLSQLLSHASKYIADGSAIYLWMFASNWDTSLMGDPAYKAELTSSLIDATERLTVLACWAWAAGLLLGSLSRRAALVNGTLFALILIVAAPMLTRHREFAPTAAVFELAFYRILYPLLIHVGVTITLAMVGIRQGTRLTKLWPNLLAAASMIAVYQFVRMPPLPMSPWLMAFSCWPIAYWLTPQRKIT